MRFLFFILLFPFSASAQFQVDTIARIDHFGTSNSFPHFSSKKSPDAAERVNVYLHHHLLNVIYGSTDSPLDSILPNEDHFWGQNEFSFHVNNNDSRVLSFTVSYASTGAYTEYVDETFTFVGATGELLSLSDLFRKSRKHELFAEVTSKWIDAIDLTISEIDPGFEYRQEQIEMYQECKDGMENSPYIGEHEFTVEGDEISFYRGRCSNHMMAALDDLWDFSYTEGIDQFTPLLTPRGASLLSDGTWKSKESWNFNDKVLKGSVDGKYPITMILHYYSDRVSGIYWYDKYKKPIQLYGSIGDDGTLNLSEELNGKKIALLSGKFESGRFSGEWKDLSSNQTRSISVGL